jgi:hypothetical protein
VTITVLFILGLVVATLGIPGVLPWLVELRPRVVERLDLFGG